MFGQSEKKKIPILMYHSISQRAAPKFRRYAVPPMLFTAQMAYLQQQQYTPLTLTQFITLRAKGSSALPERPVILTFDDGFADFFSGALPILQKFGFSATLYLVTGFIDRTSRWLQREGEASRPMLTWSQIAEINAAGIECGGHTHEHPQLDTISLNAARKEIVYCKKLLEDQLGQEVLSFAYPYGYHTSALKEFVRDAGYTSACAVKYEMSTETTEPFALSRLMVRPDTSVDALATLLLKGNSSIVTTLYRRVRVPVWRMARRCSSPLRRFVL